MGVLRFLLVHWAGAISGLALLLTAIVIAQNLEPVQFDLLFWSFPALPKLVVMLASMALGAVLAETARLLLRSRPRAAKPENPRPE
jgi:uncharacterized integral membrane protein